jgi:hypothetical protein
MKVEQGGPWHFRQNTVIIEPYDGLAATESINLNYIAVWIQIHKLPVGYRNKSLITNLVEKKVGKVIEVETAVQGIGNFVRARVKIDVRRSLARVVSLSRAGQREVYHIKYEKIPKFCAACGLLGHTHFECGSGEHAEDQLRWGDFLKANWETWHGRRTGPQGAFQGGRGRGPSGGRGRMAGGRNDVPMSWRFNATPNANNNALVECPLKDTASSPMKKTDTDMVDPDSSDSGTKRRLLLGSGQMEEGNGGPANTVPMIMDGIVGELVALEETDESDRVKRTKKDGANSSSLGSASSREELVREQ